MIENFPPKFAWGVATSSYQIEGAAHEDGRGVSIWDTFCATPGKVVNAENGDVACDHYHRYPEDIALMKELGITSYRFSLAWPRMFPNGDTQPEQRGFDFYSRLIDGLIEAGIEPVITLYHWDLPQSLEDAGGWTSREIVPAFVHYAESAVAAFGDRVNKWLTLNEPWCVTWLGYLSGVHAPGRQSLPGAIAAAHHTALAHAEATRAIKAIKPDALVGIACNMTTYRVDDESNSELTDLRTLMDGQLNRWWIDAAMYGMYPAELVAHYGADLADVVLPGDMAALKCDTDWLGVNYYSDAFIGTPKSDSQPAGVPGSPHPFPQVFDGTPPEPYTDMGWPVTPNGLFDLLKRIKASWPMITSIAITENGAAYGEGPDETGNVRDDRRSQYLAEHIQAVGKAIERGVPVDAYFAWSLMDNFEWAYGYAKRFGIVHVDFDTLKRTPKASARMYQELIARHNELNSVGASL